MSHRRKWASLLGSLTVVLALRVSLAAGQGTAKPAEDLPAGPMQSKATTACLECHEARIILQQRLSKATWTKEVDKMIKWGAVVDANDRDVLIDYLAENFGPKEPQYNPPRTSADKHSRTAGKASR